MKQDTVHAERYRNYWSTLSGRPASDVYIPEALRAVEPVPESPKPEGCGAVDADDWDACGNCTDCNPDVWAKEALR